MGGMAAEEREGVMVGLEPDGYFLDAARRAVSAAEEANQAAADDPLTSQKVKDLTARVLEEAQQCLGAIVASPRRKTSGKRERQTIAEFTTLLGEEVKEAAEESVQEGIKYAERTLRQAKSLIEDHFQIDEAFRMLGPLQQDSNLARDVHDWFNLVALLPVIAFNFTNWSCRTVAMCGLFSGRFSLPALWHGETFLMFWWTTLAYFIVDIVFVLLLPHCVRSPKVIMQHHFATIGYIMVPKLRPQYGWLMGACMVVEVNTWFLIARRSFNKKGDKMFMNGVCLSKSLRLLVVSSCFYVTWFVIRLGFYPYLMLVIIKEWWQYSEQVGTPINLIMITPIMQLIFIFLNIKWTVDLIRSKVKGGGIKKGL
mmetsp:Transcript_93246/g.241002  ORF Transcript_93246/g.241002 Transcript_93246/m.241002 type:complete len:368 (-) Transcript_93246:50-1153(-)